MNHPLSANNISQTDSFHLHNDALQLYSFLREMRLLFPSSQPSSPRSVVVVLPLNKSTNLTS